MDIITEFRTHVKTINPHDSMSGLIKNKMSIAQKETFVPESYYYLTSLVNPAQTYWSRKHPDIKKSNDILRKLILGNKLGRMASYWFRKLPEFITEEGKLDGAFVGIPRVRGAIDFRIGGSIIEFKTKDKSPDTINDIFNLYPQDLEQLAFYSVLDTFKSEKNYLVFMNNIAPYKFKAFKVTTKDAGKIKSLLIERIKILDEALATNDYSKLGRCRYYESECQYNENNLCKCESIKPLSTALLQSGVAVEYDAVFTDLLQKEMEKSNVYKDLFTTINIIAPRKLLMERKLNTESDYVHDAIKDSYVACLQNLIGKLSMNPSLVQKEKIKTMLKDERVYIAQRWINIPSSSGEFGQELLPYTVRVDKADSFEKARRPTNYALAELAIICGLYGKAKGLIFTVYPNLNDHIQVYEIIFKDPKETLSLIQKRLDALEEAMKNGEILNVEACPEWMNDDGACPLMKVCHSKEGTGCSKIAVQKH